MKVDPISTQDLKTADQVAPQFTNEQKRDELAREINLRKTVYPGQIRQGKLTQEKADRHIAIMTAIWHEYGERARADREKVQPSLALGDTKPAESESAEAPPQKQADAPTQSEPQPRTDIPAEKPTEEKGAEQA